MRAKSEYNKWCALERQWEESRFGTMQEKAYTTGFNRAIQLVEIYLEKKRNENYTESTSSRERT